MALLLVVASSVGSAATEEKVRPVAKVQPVPKVEVIEPPLAPWMILEGEPGQVEVEHLEQMLRAFRLVRLAEELELEEDEAVRMAVRMREIEEKRKQIDAIRDSILPKIREEIDVSEKVLMRIDEARLQFLISRMQERTAQHQMELQQLEMRLQEALSVEQKARMLLFQKEFQHEMQEMLQMAREARVRLPKPPRVPRAGAPPIIVPEPDLAEPQAPEPEESDSR